MKPGDIVECIDRFCCYIDKNKKYIVVECDNKGMILLKEGFNDPYRLFGCKECLRIVKEDKK